MKNTLHTKNFGITIGKLHLNIDIEDAIEFLLEDYAHKKSTAKCYISETTEGILIDKDFKKCILIPMELIADTKRFKGFIVINELGEVLSSSVLSQNDLNFVFKVSANYLIKLNDLILPLSYKGNKSHLSAFDKYIKKSEVFIPCKPFFEERFRYPIIVVN